MIILIGLIVWMVGALIVLLGDIIENNLVERIGIFVALNGFLVVIVIIIYCFI